MQKAVRRYFERFGFGGPRIESPPLSDLTMVIVIPCFQEEDLLDCLDSLRACDATEGAVEVIVVINGSARSEPEARAQNQKSWEDFKKWNAAGGTPGLKFHALYCPDLPPKLAGVGLARKIGMDEALRRFAALDHLDGIIVCYDADCRCDSNYLTAIERHFSRHPQSPGCGIYFEHPLEGNEAAAIYDAVTAYELHLRYYVRGMRHAGLPYAYHTVGSSMAARARAYMKQGGMNKRRAGEDFYFLHKIIALGNFTELTTTRVIPSPRPSHRVPFGTGRAVQAFLGKGTFNTYPPRAFENLKRLTNWVQSSGREAAVPWREAGFSEILREFWRCNDGDAALEVLRRNTASAAAWRKRFFQWFDAFKAMKFIHYARDHGYGSPEIDEAARSLLRSVTPEAANDRLAAPGRRGLLEVYRCLDRGEAVAAGVLACR